MASSNMSVSAARLRLGPQRATDGLSDTRAQQGFQRGIGSGEADFARRFGCDGLVPSEARSGMGGGKSPQKNQG